MAKEKEEKKKKKEVEVEEDVAEAEEASPENGEDKADAEVPRVTSVTYPYISRLAEQQWSKRHLLSHPLGGSSRGNGRSSRRCRG